MTLFLCPLRTSAVRLVLGAYLTVVGSASPFDTNAQAPAVPGKLHPLPPFLEGFKARRDPPLITKNVKIESAVGEVGGYLARPDTTERLPAILLLGDDVTAHAWMKQNAEELASVGYVTLALAPGDRREQQTARFPDEKTLADLAAAVRWVRRRPDVLPARLGVAGWGRGGTQALVLAASMPVQACVICDGTVTDAPDLIAGLGRTPVLGVFAENDENAPKSVPVFRKALDAAHVPHKLHVYEGAGAGFMGPPDRKNYVRQQAERAWVEVYEFLGKYVEDAPQNAPVAPPTSTGATPNQVATIADLMRAVLGPTAVRGTLIGLLEKQPAGNAEWNRVRANAALLAEAGHLLQNRRPRKGSHRDWLEQARGFTTTAETAVAAADRQDYAGVKLGLKAMAARCAACHDQHR